MADWLKKILPFATLAAIAVGSIFYLDYRAEFLTYENLMGKGSKYWKYVETTADLNKIELYKKIYEKNKQFIFSKNTKQLRIPKTVHFIWLGPKPFPPASVENVNTWMRLHSEWKFKFWTDKERDCPVLGMEKHLLQDFHFIHLQGLIDKTENYSEKSDILRFEILLQEGGLCVDPDVKCYHSFDNFHYGFDFYSALEKPNQDLGMDSAIAPAISIIGAKPGHPILRGTVELLKAYGNEEADFVNTPVKHAVNRTFKSFGEAAEANIDKGENIDIILPASFFFAWELFTAKEIKHLKKQNVVFARYFCSTEQAGSPEIEKETQLKKELERVRLNNTPIPKNEQNARM